MSKPTTAPDDPARDAHLRAALRHAPDAHEAPPPALSAALRAAAREAVEAEGAAPAKTLNPPPSRPSVDPRAPQAPWWQHAWQSLAQPRPVWAGGAAALLVSVLTVQLWHDEPLPPAVTARAAGDAERARDAAPAVRPAALEVPPAAGTAVPPSPGPVGGIEPPKASPPTAFLPPVAPPGSGDRAAAGAPVREAAKRPATPSPPATLPADRTRPPRPAPAAPPASPPAAVPRTAAGQAADHRPEAANERTRNIAEAAGAAAPARQGTSADVPGPQVPLAPPPAITVTRELPPPVPPVALAPPPAPVAPHVASPPPPIVAAPASPPAAAASASGLPPLASYLVRPTVSAARSPASAASQAPISAEQRMELLAKLARLDGRPAPPGSLGPWVLAARMNAAMAEYPLTPAQRRVLLRLDNAGMGWQLQPAATPGAAPEGSAAVSELAWVDAQGRRSTLRLGDEGARWTGPDGRQWVLPLDTPTREALAREF